MKNNRSAPRITSRGQLVERMRREIERRGYPRLQMLLLVALTCGAGFLASFALLTSGVDTLALRYPLAVGIAYVVFLLLLWIWLRTGPDDYNGLDEAVTDIVEAIPEVAADAASNYRGGGGQFSGGGSSGRWDASAEPLVELPDVPVPDVPDAEEFAIPLLVIAVVIGIVLTVLFASASVVVSAPVLFAEILVDGVLAATLYRRLRRFDRRHWLRAALRRTVVPFAITAVLLGLAGWGLSLYAPEARTLGEVFAQR